MRSRPDSAFMSTLRPLPGVPSSSVMRPGCGGGRREGAAGHALDRQGAWKPKADRWRAAQLVGRHSGTLCCTLARPCGSTAAHQQACPSHLEHAVHAVDNGVLAQHLALVEGKVGLQWRVGAKARRG